MSTISRQPDSEDGTDLRKSFVEIFTDGSCKGNPGPGGWAVLLRCNGVEKCLSGGEAHTTNNRMELTAAIKGLSALTRPCNVRLVTDSQYLKRGISEWIKNWKRRGWKTSQKTPVKNEDLWKQLDNLVSIHNVQWEWVRGHAEHEENIRVDNVARQAVERIVRRRTSKSTTSSVTLKSSRKSSD